MDQSQLIADIEKYLQGEMNLEEKANFENLRQNNPEIDQLFVECTYFLDQLDQFGNQQALKKSIRETVDKLKQQGIIKNSPLSPKSKIIYLWNQYKRTIAVAASIAIIISFLSSSIFSFFTNVKVNNLRPLVEKIREQDVKYKKLETKVNQINTSDNTTPAKSKLESNFRATGFMIDVNNNYLVTNAHVLTEATHHLVVENNKGEQFAAEAIYSDNQNDIAILKIIDQDFKKLAPLPFSIKKSTCELGEPIFTLGFPKQEIVYGEGYISAKNGYQMDSIFYQLSTLANEGNSGSPVINKNGELVGVLSSKEESSEGVVFAIKSYNIFSVVNTLKKLPSFENIKITTNPILRKTDRVTQIKKIQEYVFMIKGN